LQPLPEVLLFFVGNVLVCLCDFLLALASNLHGDLPKIHLPLIGDRVGL
jgi:hypothetical protein